MIIDTHTHVCDEKVWKEYRKKSKNLVSKVISLPDIENKLGIGKEISELLEFCEKFPSVIPAGCIDMEKNIPLQIKLHEKLFFSKKICAIKLYPGYQSFYPSDKKVFPVAKLCGKHKKPLIFHSGDFYDPKNSSLLKYSHPTYIDELAVSCPGTTIIIAHFGFPYFMETANIVSKNPNVYTDVSGTIDNWGISEKVIGNLTDQYIIDLKRALNYYPDIKNKVMFGSDFGGEDTDLNLVLPYIKVIKSIFNKKEQKNAFHGLAEKLFLS
jgi:uncharacterized protein